MSTGTLPPFRRIITTNSEGGRSRILTDAPVPHVLESAPGRGLINLWATESTPPSLDTLDDAAWPVQLEPPAGGTVFRFFQLGPKTVSTEHPDVAERAAAAAFARMGAAHLRVDTRRHPSMHKSHTLDYIVLLKGRVLLVLDEDEAELKPFDAVIQRGTNHAWINLEDEPALLMGVLMDAARDPQGGEQP
ncbi:MAG: cupin domain-containing protein [Chelatococcus sp.]|uniref:cupin domain-containing protein n=1 Tax=Chelatococcus sp. TaxID=1953771 RepID=UPI0025BD3CEC|nr:cupin domain-containing protein [Chelatococcus sp.]MBX3540862.1 cupin domain-containing protein [Chelatococcus sp.]